MDLRGRYQVINPEVKYSIMVDVGNSEVTITDGNLSNASMYLDLGSKSTGHELYGEIVIGIEQVKGISPEQVALLGAQALADENRIRTENALARSFENSDKRMKALYRLTTLTSIASAGAFAVGLEIPETESLRIGIGYAVPVGLLTSNMAIYRYMRDKQKSELNKGLLDAYNCLARAKTLCDMLYDNNVAVTRIEEK